MPVAVTPSHFDQVETPAEREQRTVHDVYESIAPHFSATRYKPWPVISRFLASIPPGSIGLDSGAGNGKYLPVLAGASAGSMMVALDRSSGLLEIARVQRGPDDGEVVEECVRADLCFNGWRGNLFDFAISIAAIHHLSTPTRRLASVRALIRPLRLTATEGHARFLIYVWAFEQGENSKRKMGALAPAEGEGEQGQGQGQDVMVPWVLQPKPQAKPRTAGRKQERTAGEEGSPAPPAPQVFHRYYHLFRQGELASLVCDAARAEGFEVVEGVPGQGGRGKKWARVVEEGYEKDNWWLEGEVGLY